MDQGVDAPHLWTRSLLSKLKFDIPTLDYDKDPDLFESHVRQMDDILLNDDHGARIVRVADKKLGRKPRLLVGTDSDDSEAGSPGQSIAQSIHLFDSLCKPKAEQMC